MQACIADDELLKSGELSLRTNVPIVSSGEAFQVRSDAVLSLVWKFEGETIRPSRERHDAEVPFPTNASWVSGNSALRDWQDF